MENSTGENCASSSSARPVVVRVKRKASQSPVEAFWLEINERPNKRHALLDFAKLSLSETPKNKEEVKNKKVLVHHIETLTNSEATIDIVQSIVPNSAETKATERTRFLKERNKQDQLLSRSKQKHENLAKNARFEQIWKSRKGKKDTMDGNLQEICHIYDVVRVDCEENYSKKEEASSSLEESLILCDYLPLLRECLPSVAEELEADMQSYISSQGSTDGYVYDLYTVQDESQANYEDSLDAYPLVLVEEDDFYDGPVQSDFESDDSNAEDNPLNEYPDEETSEEEEEEEEEDNENEKDDDDEDKDEDEETESSDNQSVEFQIKHYNEDDDLFYEEDDSFDDDYSEDDEDNRL